MSVASTLELESMRILDARLSQNQSTRSWQTTIGGSNVTYRKERSNASSDSQVSFQLTPNSPNNVIDRTFMLVADVNVAFAATNLGGSFVLNPGDNACRGFSSIVESTNVSINGLTISQETKYVKDIYNRFSDDLDNLVKFQSITPSLSTEGDNFTEYETGFGTFQNVLAGYRDSNRRTTGRSFYPIEILTNTASTATIRFRMVELFTLSPLEYEGLMVPGLANVTSLQLNFNLSSNKQRFWSRSRVGLRENETTFTVTPTFSNYEVHFCEITLPVFYSLPPSIALSYYDVQRQVTRNDTTLYNFGESFDINTNTYQLNQTPSRIIILVRPPLRDDPTETDTFAAIESIDIQYNNMSSILASASQEQLFQISSRNGSTQHYTEFRGYSVDYATTSITGLVGTTGSIVALDFGKDISADPTALPGTSINANFNIRVRGKYYGLKERALEVHIFYVYAGVMVISPGSAFAYRSLLTRDQTLSLPLLEGDGSGSSNLKGGVMKQYGNVGFNKLYKGAREALDGSAMAGARAAGVHTSGRSSGLQGGQAKSKSALMDAFK
jgi:hypothetical protein